MKGLLIKDILNIKNYMKQLSLVLIFFIAYGLFFKNGIFVGSMITFMLSMQVITTMSYDEYAKWDKYALTMNINRNDIVSSKYVFFIILVLIGTIFGIISSLFINIIVDANAGIGEILIPSIITPTVVVSSICLILFSIVLPIMFKIGVEKARVFMIAIFFIPAIMLFLFFEIMEKNNIAMPNEATLEMVFKFGAVGLIILTVLIVFISYKISLSIYNKKEF